MMRVGMYPFRNSGMTDAERDRVIAEFRKCFE